MPMDDELYQNAWTETTTTIPATLKEDPAPAWTPTKLTSSYSEEADLAAPSWSTGAGIHWNEPGSPGFSWSQAEADSGWGSSTYEGISLSKPTTDEAPVILSVAEEAKESLDVDTASSTDDTPDSVDSPSPTVPSPTVLEPVSLVGIEITPALVAPPSPDGFGSFETGFHEEESVQSPSFALPGAQTDPWGSSAWAEAEPEESDEPEDEWERARQVKAKLDRRVPPELLEDILRQCEELGRDICPDPEETAAGEGSWRDDWRTGLDGVPGLNALMDSFLPPLSLQGPIRFPQASVAKKMASCVKMTKNLPLARGSPMAHYLAAKGSTAWETSVKEQKDAIEDDIPMGWRIVEKAPTAASLDGAKDKKPTGRLFSFWGRRQSQISTPSTASGGGIESRSSSMESPKSPVVDEVKTEPRRPSQDSVRSVKSGPQSRPHSTAELPSASQAPAAFAAIVAPASSSYSSAPDPAADRSGTPPAPSAVSRFLNRFSRRNSGMSGSPHNSLALSSDDIEFLSDIVPSASDDVDEDSTDALEKFVNTKFEPAVVPALAPPLLPPPKAPANQSNGVPKGSSPFSVQGSSAGESFGGLLSSFASGDSTTVMHSNSGSTRTPTSITALPPPLVPSRPITPSATPGAGPSHVPISLAATSGLAPSSRPSSRPQASTLSFALPPPPAFKQTTSSITQSMSSKPKLSSPFPLPRPPPLQDLERPPSSASTSSSRTSYETAAESSPASPTSSLPLGTLYPHLVSPISPPQRSSLPMLSVPPSSDTASTPPGLSTPLASAFPPAPSAFDPPTPHVRTANPPSSMALTPNFFGDDDFADFQSPVESTSRPSPTAPPPIAKSPRTLAAAVPLAARPQKAPSSLSPFTLPPPPGPAQSSSTAPVTTFTSFDDDDFADFQAPPSSATGLHPNSSASSNNSLFPTSVSEQALLTPKKNSGFDDMGDFFSSTLRTPSPPRVPAKTSPPNPPLQPPPSSTSLPSVNSASSSSSLFSRRRTHAAEHLHTLNLVEKAAARPGRWPAPASPLPAAIPGPFGASSTSAHVNLLEDDAPPAAAAALAPSYSSPATLNPGPARPSSGMGAANGAGLAESASAASNSSLLQGWDFQSSTAQRTATPPMAPSGVLAAPSVNGSQPGKLSAQDLSFFESL
ncbi:hypothetical protein BD413DRAFT_567981 [Trametes elegans]|nr:hypothetical protein BD413DRAFT_567981 [Trametes elegans]